VKGVELLDPAEVFTMTWDVPGLSELGTEATIWLALQLEAVAGTPLNVTVLVPWVAPKFAPLIVTREPVVPDAGDRLVMIGFELTVKLSPLLTTPDSVITTLPVVAPVGTGTTMLVEPQLEGVASVPLNVTVLEL
jgi:hypothetical protein